MRTSGVLHRVAGLLAAGVIAGAFLLPGGADGAHAAGGGSGTSTGTSTGSTVAGGTTDSGTTSRTATGTTSRTTTATDSGTTSRTATGTSSATTQGTIAAAPRSSCPRRPSTPVSVSVPAIRVHATVLPISLHGSQLDPPSNWHQVGWWNQSTKPGLAYGRTVMTGHTTHWSTNGGVFNSLGAVRTGQNVFVNTANGCLIDYQVVSVKNLSHSQLSSQARSLFGQTSGGGNLVLITCGAWDGHEYHTNIVVTARPLGWVL